MPEISQDNFESLYPSEPPATVQELRARANSASSRRDVTESSASTLTPVVPRNRRPKLSSESGEYTFFEFQTNNAFRTSYKREMSHRWVNRGEKSKKKINLSHAHLHWNVNKRSNI